MVKSKWQLYTPEIIKLYCDKCDRLYPKDTKTKKGRCIICGAQLKKYKEVK